jgi:hypothetical protein
MILHTKHYSAVQLPPFVHIGLIKPNILFFFDSFYTYSYQKIKSYQPSFLSGLITSSLIKQAGVYFFFNPVISKRQLSFLCINHLLTSDYRIRFYVNSVSFLILRYELYCLI